MGIQLWFSYIASSLLSGGSVRLVGLMVVVWTVYSGGGCRGFRTQGGADLRRLPVGTRTPQGGPGGTERRPGGQGLAAAARAH